jgi:hypothetical protein
MHLKAQPACGLPDRCSNQSTRGTAPVVERKEDHLPSHGSKAMILFLKSAPKRCTLGMGSQTSCFRTLITNLHLLSPVLKIPSDRRAVRWMTTTRNAPGQD